jgi:hypothetical protein
MPDIDVRSRIAEYIQSVEAIEDTNKTRDRRQRATLGNPRR